MNYVFSHWRPDGSLWGTVVPDDATPGVYWEIAARGYPSFEDIVLGWQESPSHAMVLGLNAVETGVCWDGDVLVVIVRAD